MHQRTDRSVAVEGSPPTPRRPGGDAGGGGGKHTTLPHVAARLLRKRSQEWAYFGRAIDGLSGVQ